MFKFIIFSVAIAAAAAINCGGLDDGVYEVSCKSYAVCENGVSTVHHCEEKTVFNTTLQTCVDEATQGEPCGLVKDCSNVQDGSYPDYQNGCTSYYTCSNGYYYSHNNCPAGLVFEVTMQICTWSWDAFPPCGTKEE